MSVPRGFWPIAKDAAITWWQRNLANITGDELLEVFAVLNTRCAEVSQLILEGVGVYIFFYCYGD